MRANDVPVYRTIKNTHANASLQCGDNPQPLCPSIRLSCGAKTKPLYRRVPTPGKSVSRIPRCPRRRGRLFMGSAGSRGRPRENNAPTHHAQAHTRTNTLSLSSLQDRSTEHDGRGVDDESPGHEADSSPGHGPTPLHFPSTGWGYSIFLSCACFPRQRVVATIGWQQRFFIIKHRSKGGGNLERPQGRV